MSGRSGPNSTSTEEAVPEAPSPTVPLAPARRRSSPRRRRARRAFAVVLLSQLLLLGVLLGIWEWATHDSRANAFLFGSPSVIAADLVGMMRDGSLWRDTYVTGVET